VVVIIVARTGMGSFEEGRRGGRRRAGRGTRGEGAGGGGLQWVTDLARPGW